MASPLKSSPASEHHHTVFSPMGRWEMWLEKESDHWVACFESESYGATVWGGTEKECLEQILILSDAKRIDTIRTGPTLDKPDVPGRYIWWHPEFGTNLTTVERQDGVLYVVREDFGIKGRAPVDTATGSWARYYAPGEENQ